MVRTHVTNTACLLLCFITIGEAIRCYQCGSDQDPKGEDNCGAYKKFDKSYHIAVECNSEESHMPGSFCMKITQQGPKGFIWDGRWRQVIRRCASVADTGVTGVCNWGVFKNGVYWEECYCSQDECNASSVKQTCRKRVNMKPNFAPPASIAVTVIAICVMYILYKD